MSTPIYKPPQLSRFLDEERGVYLDSLSHQRQPPIEAALHCGDQLETETKRIASLFKEAWERDEMDDTTCAAAIAEPTSASRQPTVSMPSTFGSVFSKRKRV